MLIWKIPKIPILTKRSRRRERRMLVQKDRITTGTVVSVKRIIQILWLTPMCRVMHSIVRVNRPSAMEA